MLISLLHSDIWASLDDDGTVRPLYDNILSKSQRAVALR
jgi:hypothetical protein